MSPLTELKIVKSLSVAQRFYNLGIPMLLSTNSLIILISCQGVTKYLHISVTTGCNQGGKFNSFNC